MENEYYYAGSIEEIDAQIQIWKSQFKDTYEYLKSGVSFVLVQRHRGDYVLYMIRLFFDVNREMYIEEIQRICMFSSYEEVYSKCNQVIEDVCNAKIEKGEER